MNTAVGIDVSKGKSVVAAMRPFGEVAMPPQEFLHTSEDLSALMQSLCLIDGNKRVILEATGRYHEPVVAALREAGIFVSVVNPKLIKDFGGAFHGWPVGLAAHDNRDALPFAGGGPCLHQASFR